MCIGAVQGKLNPFSRSNFPTNEHASHWFVNILAVCRWWVMSKVMYKSNASYVSCRAGVYYYTRRVPYDVRQHYASNRLSFSLRTKSNAGALRAAQSVTQRLEDYWLGLRLQDMDIPAIHLVKANHVDDSSPLMSEAVENYLRIKGMGSPCGFLHRIFFPAN